MALSRVEMEWLESRRFTLTEICAAFGTLPSLFIPDAKFTNQDVAVRYMWENGAKRLLEGIQDDANLKLVADADRRKVFLHYDTNGVKQLEEPLEDRLKAHLSAVQGGIPINRSIVMLDLPTPP